MTCPQGVDGCRHAPGRPRHNHHSYEISRLGEKCPSCARTDWTLLFGGILPARLQCSSCGHGFNLSEAIRRGQPSQPVSYRGA